MASPAILSNFFEEKGTQNHPQYLSGLSRALFPTTFLEIAVYFNLVYTKTGDSVFRALWLASESVNILHYSLIHLQFFRESEAKLA